MKQGTYSYALGRRKNASATIRLYEGKGVSMVNAKTLEVAYPAAVDRKIIVSPLAELGLDDKYYFTAKTTGGGTKGQRNAIRHAMARALVKIDAEYKKPLKQKKLLTRDDRMVERKHTGFVKARKKPQYSKR